MLFTGGFPMIKVLTILSLTIVFVVVPGVCLANSAPVVSNVSASQRADDSKLVDIYYDLADADGDNCTVWVFISSDGGLTWDVPVFTFSGDAGKPVSPGVHKHIIWDAGHDIPGKIGTLRARVFADDGKAADDMVAVPAGHYLVDGVGAPVFVDTFLIDRYEVTNLRYCEFLNATDPNGDHWGVYMEIGRSGSLGFYSYSVNPGKENYPVAYVNFYNATAFAQWRSSVTGLHYSLPSKYQWQKVAAWDPVENKFYLYGCHSDFVDCSWGNYASCLSNNLTRVGYYNGEGGRNDAKSYYGCYDMFGNVSEWTTEDVSYGGAWGYKATRGGNSENSSSWSSTTSVSHCLPESIVAEAGGVLGFRLVREP
jgi:formylglycine-generating enzyme required for sulfatase activity